MISVIDYLKNEFLLAAEAGLEWEIRLNRNMSIMPAGNNGPYFHLESPVRNTSHWIITYLVAYNISRDKRFLNAALRLVSFFKKYKAYGAGYSYVQRQHKGHDWCNGVIGTAWIIESLSRAAKYLEDEQIKIILDNIVKKQNFNYSVGAWKRLDPQRGYLSIDYAYNHQAWMAVAIADYGLHGIARLFLDKSEAMSFRIRKGGLINHIFYANTSKNIVNRILYNKQRIYKRDQVNIKENGYHLYVLFALARLYQHFPGHTFFKTGAFVESLRYCNDKYLESLRNNPYAYPYNSPAFELPLIKWVFNEDMIISDEKIKDIFMVQKNKTQNNYGKLYTEGTADPATLSARIYELGIFIESVQQDNEDN